MTNPDPNEAMREVAREVLRELVPELLQAALAHPPAQAGNGDGNGQAPAGADGDGVVPPVPAPPVAMVLRPSTWSGPEVAGEVVGGAEPPTTGPPVDPPSAESPGSSTHVETVTIDTDEDLERFVRALVRRSENPRDRLAIRAGRLRFALRRAHVPAGGAAGPSTRVEKGAVTERTVSGAAATGTRLVLGPSAVLTPLARDQARALGVEIERERRC
jgi:hypothetical protein